MVTQKFFEELEKEFSLKSFSWVPREYVKPVSAAASTAASPSELAIEGIFYVYRVVGHMTKNDGSAITFPPLTTIKAPNQDVWFEGAAGELEVASGPWVYRRIYPWPRKVGNVSTASTTLNIIIDNAANGSAVAGFLHLEGIEIKARAWRERGGK